MKEYSRYHLMWMLVMFDLPTGLQRERKAASDFRKGLLDLGFQMSQFSVYMKYIGTRETCDKFVKKIRKISPASGQINIMFLTDKQFAQSINIIKIDKRSEIANEQLVLF